MWKKLAERIRSIEDSTPVWRNRYADFLRVVAIVFVVIGHWVVAHITVDNEFIRARTVLVIVAETRWLTWVFQVMPLFFFVGGFLNARSWNSAIDRGDTYADWIRRRSRRLLRPLIALLVVWIGTVCALAIGDTATYLVVMASYAALLPIWFIAVYLLIVAISPAAYRLHRRFGLGVVIALFAGAVAVDLLVALGVQWVGWANFAIVWAAIHQLGFFWRDGRLSTNFIAGVGLAIAAVGVALALVEFADYPVSMVATGEGGRTNDYPPNLVLLALGVAQVGIIAAFYRPLQQWLQRPWPWALITTLGNRMMTVFLWHMTALVVVAWLVYSTEIWPVRDTVDAVWWLLQIPWVALLAVALLVLVGIFGRFEQPESPETTDSANWFLQLRVGVGVVLSALGLTLIVTGGLYTGDGLAGIAWWPLALVATGFIALDVIDLSTVLDFSGRRPSPDDQPDENGDDPHHKREDPVGVSPHDSGK